MPLHRTVLFLVLLLTSLPSSNLFGSLKKTQVNDQIIEARLLRLEQQRQKEMMEATAEEQRIRDEVAAKIQAIKKEGQAKIDTIKGRRTSEETLKIQDALFAAEEAIKKEQKERNERIRAYAKECARKEAERSAIYKK